MKIVEKGDLAASRALFSSDRTDWETPPELFATLNEIYHFDLDVCATAENAKCARFFSPQENGLTQEWRGMCWMNPPYGREIAKWVSKAWLAGQAGTTVVCLLPARTDAKWWHLYVMDATYIAFMPGRIRFVGAQAGAPFPSAVVIFGPGPKPPFPTVRAV